MENMLQNFFNSPSYLDFSTINILLLLNGSILSIISMKLMFSKNAINSVILLSLFSLLLGIFYLIVDAPDVAMTEVALGACFSTCVTLNVINYVGSDLKIINKTKIIFAGTVCIIFFIFLCIIGSDIYNLPCQIKEHKQYSNIENSNVGDVSCDNNFLTKNFIQDNEFSKNTPVHLNMSKGYIDNAHKDIGLPAIVTGILASYRGYDTLYETTVIFIAGICVMLINSKKKEDV